MASRTATRINEAVAMLLASRSASGVVSELSERHSVTRRQARRYVASAYEVIKADVNDSDIDREKLVSQLVHALQESMAQAVKANHPCSVVSCARELRELLGLGADAKPRSAPPTPYRIGHGS